MNSGKKMKHQQTLFGRTAYALYNGKLKEEEQEGSFIFLKGRDDSFGAVFQFGGRTFEMVALNKKEGLLREVDYDWFKGAKCGVNDDENLNNNEEDSLKSNTDPCLPAPSSCLNRLTIVNAYAQETVDHINASANGNAFIASIYVAMVSATFKSALENSGIELPRLQIIDHNIGYFGFTNNISDDLSKFSTSYTSQLRQLYNSDREMLLAPAA